MGVGIWANWHGVVVHYFTIVLRRYPKSPSKSRIHECRCPSALARDVHNTFCGL